MASDISSCLKWVIPLLVIFLMSIFLCLSFKRFKKYFEDFSPSSTHFALDLKISFCASLFLRSSMFSSVMIMASLILSIFFIVVSNSSLVIFSEFAKTSSWSSALFSIEISSLVYCNSVLSFFDCFLPSSSRKSQILTFTKSNFWCVFKWSGISSIDIFKFSSILVLVSSSLSNVALHLWIPFPCLNSLIFNELETKKWSLSLGVLFVRHSTNLFVKDFDMMIISSLLLIYLGLSLPQVNPPQVLRTR